MSSLIWYRNIREPSRMYMFPSSTHAYCSTPTQRLMTSAWSIEAWALDLLEAEYPVDAGFPWFKGCSCCPNGLSCPVDLLSCGS
jgi:hypothetical protein